MLNLYGPLNDLGYGIVTRGIIQGLSEVGINNIHINPIGGNIQIENQEEAQSLMTKVKTNFWSRQNPSLAVWHEFDLSKFSGKKLLALPIFETTDFFPIAKSYLSQMDAVVVLSTWAKEVIHNSINSNLPVFVVPAAANIIKEIDSYNMPKSNCFTFFSAGKLEKRKGHEDIIKAYIQAFKKFNGETRLRIHCFSPFEKNFPLTILNLLKSLNVNIVNSVHKNLCIVGNIGNAIIEIPTNRLPADQLAILYKTSHVGVFPSRAEGWNLPLMECIQYGTPCIASNYSAHTEYLNENFNYPKDLLLEGGSMELAHDNKFFHGDRGYWKSIDLDELSNKMLYSYTNYNKIISDFDNSKIKEEFTWKNTATKLLKVLEEV